MKLLRFMACSFLFAWSLSAQEPENKAASVQILKTTYEQPWLRLVVLNNSDEAIREFITTIDQVTNRKRYWPVVGSPVPAKQSIVLQYYCPARPSQVSLDGVIFVDGYGEGVPAKLHESFLRDEAYVDGLRTAIEVLGEAQALLPKSGHASESLERFSQAQLELKSRLHKSRHFKTDEEMWRKSGHDEAIQAAADMLEAWQASIERLRADPYAELAQPKNAADLNRKVGNKMKEILHRISLLEKALRSTP